MLLLSVSIASPRQTPSSVGRWQSVSACRVTFRLPPDARLESDQGIDSCVREYSARELLIILDVTVGVLDTDIEFFRRGSANKPDFRLQETVVDRRRALIITYYDPELPEHLGGRCYVAELLVPSLGRRPFPGALWMRVYSETAEGQATASRIFASTRLRNR